MRCEDALSSKGGSSVGDVITCAGDLINSFVQLNWMGPPAPAVVGEWLVALVGGSSLLSRRNKESLQELSWDGEVTTNILIKKHMSFAESEIKINRHCRFRHGSINFFLLIFFSPPPLSSLPHCCSTWHIYCWRSVGIISMATPRPPPCFSCTAGD